MISEGFNALTYKPTLKSTNQPTKQLIHHEINKSHIENPGRKVEKEKASESWQAYRTNQLAAASEFLRANHLDLGLQGLQSFSIIAARKI